MKVIRSVLEEVRDDLPVLIVIGCLIGLTVFAASRSFGQATLDDVVAELQELVSQVSTLRYEQSEQLINLDLRLYSHATNMDAKAVAIQAGIGLVEDVGRQGTNLIARHLEVSQAATNMMTNWDHDKGDASMVDVWVRNPTNVVTGHVTVDEVKGTVMTVADGGDFGDLTEAVPDPDNPFVGLSSDEDGGFTFESWIPFMTGLGTANSAWQKAVHDHDVDEDPWGEAFTARMDVEARMEVYGPTWVSFGGEEEETAGRVVVPEWSESAAPRLRKSGASGNWGSTTDAVEVLHWRPPELSGSFPSAIQPAASMVTGLESKSRGLMSKFTGWFGDGLIPKVTEVRVGAMGMPGGGAHDVRIKWPWLAGGRPEAVTTMREWVASVLVSGTGLGVLGLVMAASSKGIGAG